jgi:hypothetical protein
MRFKGGESGQKGWRELESGNANENHCAEARHFAKKKVNVGTCI